MSLISGILWNIWFTAREMAPYLLFGFAAAGALSVAASPETVRRHLGGRGLWPVVKASAFGVPLPLCSCGVIPVGASLRRHGATRGATAAFLLSTPQTGVDSIMVTWSLLGPAIAIFRPIAALLTGILGGWLVDTAEGRDAADHKEDTPVCENECCRPTARRHPLAQALRHAFVVLPADVARPMVVGLALASLIGALVPPGFFAGTALGGGWTGMLLMMAVSVPLYVCATGSVPVAAALMLKGVSPGSAMVFLMTGPATNAATIATIWKLLGRKTAAVYLGVIVVGALLSGWLLDHVLKVAPPQPGTMRHEMLPDPLVNAAAWLLFALLAWALAAPAWHRARAARVVARATRQWPVRGMTCSGCEARIEETLRALPGVASVAADRAQGLVAVSGSADDATIVRAIEELGYEVGGRDKALE